MTDDEGAELIMAALEYVRSLLLADPLTWEREAVTVTLPPLLRGREAEFVQWARHHLRWSLVLAEQSLRLCAKPREAAVGLLLAIATELLEDDGTLDQ